ncbi:Structural protein p49 [Labeo rohita]|uniref:Structural protein p49 n=1 Tax=Labeo rohita TaxID=84645 RepID=A0ABQ8MS72_LABRO|nr:Structural protein p49 [Labeo rohita]
MTGRYMRLPWDAPLQHDGPSGPLKEVLQNNLKALDECLRDTRISVSVRQAEKDNKRTTEFDEKYSSQSYLYSNIFVRDDPDSEQYKLIANDKFLRRWNVLQSTKVNLVRWDVDRSYGAVCDRFRNMDKTDTANFDLNGSTNGLPNVDALSISWPRYTRFDNPWKETHVERCLGKEVQQWFIKTFPPYQTDKCINKVVGTPGMKVPMDICYSSFARIDYTWANFIDDLFQYDVTMLLANKSVIRMEHLHDHLESTCSSPTSMVYNVTAWMHVNMFHLCLEIIASRRTTLRVPQSIDLIWKDFKPHQVYMWPQVSDVALGDEWFDREKQFLQFLRPVPTVQELRDVHSRMSHCRYNKLVHAIGPEWYPADKYKCNRRIKNVNNFLKQIKTTDVFAGYEYLNSLWLRSTGEPFMSDPEEPSANTSLNVCVYRRSDFYDVTNSVEEFVEEAWNEFVAASEDVVMEIMKYVLYVESQPCRRGDASNEVVTQPATPTDKEQSRPPAMGTGILVSGMSMMGRRDNCDPPGQHASPLRLL